MELGPSVSPPAFTGSSALDMPHILRRGHLWKLPYSTSRQVLRSRQVHTEVSRLGAGAGWKKYFVEVTRSGQLRYYKHVSSGEQVELRGCISLEDAICNAIGEFVGSDGTKFCALELQSERSSSVRSGRWWVRRDYVFAVKQSAYHNWIETIVRAREANLDDGWTRVYRSELMMGRGLDEDEYGNAVCILPQPCQLTDGTCCGGCSSGHQPGPSGRVLGSFAAFVKRVASELVGIGGAHSQFEEQSKHLPKVSGSVWLLGCRYEESELPSFMGAATSKFMIDHKSRILMTYRRGFPPLSARAPLCSDSGWGCMLRSGQMLLAQTLLCHTLGREWRVHACTPPPKAYVNLLSWFDDDPEAPLSIHRWAHSGAAFGCEAGSWMGPATAALVMEDLLQQRQFQTLRHFRTQSARRLHVYVAQHGEVAINTADKLCQAFETTAEDTAPVSGDASSAEGGRRKDWDGSMLLLLPLRLGNELSSAYVHRLGSYVKHYTSMGFIGGHPKKAHYFMGVHGHSAFYLDPHKTQRSVQIGGTGNERLDTSIFHTSDVRQMRLRDLDPSLTLAYYAGNRRDFLQLCSHLRALVDDDPFPVVSVVDEASDYSRAYEENAVSEVIDDPDWEDGATWG